MSDHSDGSFPNSDERVLQRNAQPSVPPLPAGKSRVKIHSITYSQYRVTTTVSPQFWGTEVFEKPVYRVTHQISDYILLALIWKFHHVAYMPCQFCQIC